MAAKLAMKENLQCTSKYGHLRISQDICHVGWQILRASLPYMGIVTICWIINSDILCSRFHNDKVRHDRCRFFYTWVHPLKNNGTLTPDPKGKASLLNTYFQSVFTREPPLSLKQQCQYTILDNTQDSGFQYPTMPEIIITREVIIKLLKNLKSHKAAGPDDLAPAVLKELSTEIAPALQKIYTKSIQTHIIPSDWKKARICPIFKKGDKDRPENYRLISLTCICSKILEHIITSCVMSHLEAYNILYPLQHGFRKNRSCESQLLEFVTDLIDAPPNTKQTDVIIMNFSKAFDNRLLFKLVLRHQKQYLRLD